MRPLLQSPFHSQLTSKREKSLAGTRAGPNSLCALSTHPPRGPLQKRDGSNRRQSCNCLKMVLARRRRKRKGGERKRRSTEERYEKQAKEGLRGEGRGGPHGRPSLPLISGRLQLGPRLQPSVPGRAAWSLHSKNIKAGSQPVQR